VSEKDPSCEIEGTKGTDFVAKCDVSGGDLDPGECVEITLEIAGEQPTLGAGVAYTVTKAGPECTCDAIQGPSCEPCGGNGDGDECLTRTLGFYGTHPHIAAQFLPITVCGVDQTTTDAGVCGTSEALCTNAKDRKGNETSLSLVAQLTAAKLNLAATDQLTDGACGDWEYDGKTIEEWIDSCELTFCGASKQQISRSGCIEALDDFNNSLDVLADTPAPFDRPGPAQVAECQEARGNGISNYSCEQPS
jgi:hypothetical protein